MNVDELRSNFPITRHYNFMNHAAVAPLSVWIFMFAISIPADLAPDASPADHPAQEEVQETPVDAPAKPLSIMARIIVPVAALILTIVAAIKAGPGDSLAVDQVILEFK